MIGKIVAVPLFVIGAVIGLLGFLTMGCDLTARAPTYPGDGVTQLSGLALIFVGGGLYALASKLWGPEQTQAKSSRTSSDGRPEWTPPLAPMPKKPLPNIPRDLELRPRARASWGLTIALTGTLGLLIGGLAL